MAITATSSPPIELPVLPRTRRMALVGSPNSGKSTLFNSLTGLKAKVANYPGVTVERVEGELMLPDGRRVELVDLPGVYGTEALSLDERVTLDVLQGRMAGCPPVDGILFVADSTTLSRSLPLIGAFLRMKLPFVLVLTMIDEIKARGGLVHKTELEEQLGVPVVGIVGTRGIGLDDLKAVLLEIDQLEFPSPRVPVPPDPSERFAWSDEILQSAYNPPHRPTTMTDRLDSVLLHPVGGMAVFGLVMLFFFQAIFNWAAPLQDGLEAAVLGAGGAIGPLLGTGYLRSLVVDGLFAGIGSVVVFVPQIALLFALLSLLEQVGYMGRAVFLIDRVMGWVGLDGRSFVALLSSYACAVPGIMATRSIPDTRSRLATILVSPLITCSARLPVYTLLIAAFVPAVTVAGVLNLQGLVMMSLYLLGAATAMGLAALLRHGPLRGRTVPFYVELPPYRLPTFRTLARGVWLPVYRFLRRAGTIILAATLILWILLTLPAVEPPPEVAAQGAQAAAAYQLEHSAAGRLGRMIEPVVAPLGFDWKISIGLVASLAAREVIVATLGQIYAVEAADDDVTELASVLPAQLGSGAGPEDPLSLATALSLLVFFVFALQCVSTLAVMRRETGSWKWPAGAFAGFFLLAWTAAWITFRTTLWMAS